MAASNANGAAQTQAAAPAEKPDNGPQPSPTPAQDKPGSPPANNPVENPSAPPNGTPEGPFPNASGEGNQPSADFMDAFNETDPGAHLRSLLGDEGSLAGVDPASMGIQPEGQQPQTPQGQGQQPGANGQVNPAPNGQQAGQQQQGQQPGQPGQVAPELLQRLLMGGGVQQQQPTGQPAGGFWPAAQPQVQQQGQPQPQQQQPEQWVPFDAPVALPPAIIQALDSDDANTRVNAISATLAAFGNHIAGMMDRRIAEHHLPRAAQGISANVRHQSQVERVQTDLFGSFPQLRFASPALIQQAAQVVIQDELSRNPHAGYTPEIAKRIGELASQALASIGGGQPPQFQQAPVQQQQYQPAAPQQGWYPPQQQQGGYYPQQPGYAPPPNGQYMAGPGAGNFGPNFNPSVTPESEFNSFLGGGW